MSLVLPGTTIPLPSSSRVTLGPGIAPAPSRADPLASEPTYSSTRAGLLSSAAKGKAADRGESLWVEGVSKRYVAAQRDIVLGSIIARHAEGYRVEIGSAHPAALDGLAFEGATKRSKPNLKVGTLVYARVSLANRDMEPELECVDPATGRSEGFGELKGGLMVCCSLQLCRKLLSPKYPLLQLLAAHIPFETAIGLNGRVWFKAASVDGTIALQRIIEAVDAGTLDATDKAEVDKTVKSFLA
ncbi:hypothetical protein CcaverHIS002_0110530 [Cutaneotrichosporon cavernicola]|uniref:Ribosomal RNA-processing protein 40 n=1 Tax=Cutaneotrichosporon cavernicola TaxID=279322 RepID=A0AA48L0J9_9TREE|nr:uncharacterized protein CcaverHIS019_0110430 [Cutaneotrichosporon cavernicola]BEI80524.1 hypothetical protein CcaverHIS002_0110530 [Cutaneotrichosporon cavernicola]BEI88325.1 hypothetical protein CcaverHIS019_0110430 [Cutaneotrichosporon cavernicola]BEI96098.1 hypothetical protein CcaverHIS631_0110470 [Cutaneotrichosporon cavernicola]BEJ03870.1 hypothetical protein CcaverHIS641_0110450 [Cutaneotrichosporon cavernicola]